ncbi:hypothetical protein MPSEU_000606300 [Mayamaea pseudoterrestris]|nr:hypothetical protein MPSEU_000605800 [Mayamaea pseudoterrestris]GKY96468.1 hypothetical protein MPSEU_000606300 [Mayamaea pseudoterrestris]
MLHLRTFTPMLLLLGCEAFSLQRHFSRRQSPLAFPSSRLLSSAAAIPEGLTKSVQTPGNGPPVSFGDICTLSYSCYVVDNKDDSKLFAKARSQKFMIGDGSMIEAWEKIVPTMRVGERSIVRVNDPSLGYGSAGVPPVVPPNAILELDIELITAQAATANIDFDSIAMAEKVPKTAADIEAAFALKMAGKSDEPKLEGFELFLKKAKNFYFFGLFEGETGERPPWILRPSITFPLAFAIVGAAFYISYAGGAISERGAQVKDELDEIILSMTGIDARVPTSLLAATANVAASVMDVSIL